MSYENYIKPGERVDDLERNGLHILQRPGAFCFGMDAVLLAAFTRLRKRERVVDLGTGTGILPLLLSQNEPTATFEAIEIQPDMADMAARSVLMNGLESRVCVHACDLRDAWERLGRGQMGAVVCNPPYGKQNGTLISETEGQRVSRHEQDCTIRDVARAASLLLRDLGRCTLAFPAQRLLELCDALREWELEPKRVRMVCAKVEKPPYLALVEAVKHARPALLWEPPLVVYHADGGMTDELKRIYHME